MTGGTGWVVAPFTGAWIEMELAGLEDGPEIVAPFTGAWIEMLLSSGPAVLQVSLPSRERGLKSEILLPYRRAGQGRSLHGSVD